jgi:hypothetical protein
MNDSQTTINPVVPVNNPFNNSTINIEPILCLVDERAGGNFQDFGKRIDDIIRELITSPELRPPYSGLADIMFMLFEIRDAFNQVQPVSEGGLS